MKRSLTCLPCYFKCAECNSDPDVCDSCNALDFRENAPDCGCMAGYYETNVATCGKCHYSCGSCLAQDECESDCDGTRDYNAVTKKCVCQ